MSVVRLVLFFSVVLAAVGLLSAVVLQAELALPGLQVFLTGVSPDPGAFYDISAVHALVSYTALPVILLGGGGLALMSRNYEEGARLRLVFSVLALVVSMAAMLALIGAVSLVTDEGVPIWMTRGFANGALAAAAISAGIALAACASDPISRRASAAWAVFGLGFLVLTTALQTLAGATGGAQMHDTQFETGLRHAIGGALVCLAFGLISAILRRSGKRLSSLGSTIVAGLFTLAWSSNVLSLVRLGYLGMPRSYMDYPEVFAPDMMRASLSALVSVAILAAALARFALARRETDGPGPASVF